MSDKEVLRERLVHRMGLLRVLECANENHDEYMCRRSEDGWSEGHLTLLRKAVERAERNLKDFEEGRS